MKVVIVGSGNVATVLGRKIAASGHEIIQVAGRNRELVLALSSLLKANYTLNLDNISPLGDIYMIAVSDAAVSTIARRLKLNSSLIVHTAAAVSKEVLNGCSASYGVMYPLQSLNSHVATIPPIPVLIDGNTEKTIEMLAEFTRTWAENVEVATDEERIKLHLAAVFVNNFTNHLFSIAEAICRSNGLDFNMLYSLIEETVERINGDGASTVQTGPAIRNDVGTIRRHQELLKSTPDFLNLYNTLTTSIMTFHNKDQV